MRIDGSSPGPIGAENAEARRKALNANNDEGGSSTRELGKSQSEAVAMSGAAQALGKVKDPESPDLDRIERLRQAINSGTFLVDPEKIASAMLRDEVE